MAYFPAANASARWGADTAIATLISPTPSVPTRCTIATRSSGQRATASAQTKPATLSTGAVINVPLFVEEGEWLKIDTRNGEYVERVKK